MMKLNQYWIKKPIYSGWNTTSLAILTGGRLRYSKQMPLQVKRIRCAYLEKHWKDCESQVCYFIMYVHALPQYDYYHYAFHVHTYSELDGRANSISTKCERGEVCSDRKVLPGSPGKLLWQAENERGIQWQPQCCDISEEHILTAGSRVCSHETTKRKLPTWKKEHAGCWSRWYPPS